MHAAEIESGWYALLGAIVAAAAQDYRTARPGSLAYATAAQFLAAAGLLGRVHQLPGRGVSSSRGGA